MSRPHRCPHCHNWCNWNSIYGQPYEYLGVDKIAFNDDWPASVGYWTPSEEDAGTYVWREGDVPDG